MKKTFIGLILWLTPICISAQVKSTATQAVFSYTASNAVNCTVEVSTSASYAPVVFAVDATKFSAANSDGQTNIGARQFVVGQKWIAQENVSPPAVSVGAGNAAFHTGDPNNRPPAIVTVTVNNSFVIGDNVAVTGMTNTLFNDAWTRIVRVSGTTLTYELPTGTTATGTSGGGTITRANRYSLALAANTAYFYRIGGAGNTCGASPATGTFTTMNIPNGNTWAEGPLQDSSSPLNQLYPTIFDDRTTTYNDPLTGAVMKRLALYGDAGVGGGGGVALEPANGAASILRECSSTLSNSGYHCMIGAGTAVDTLYWINPTTGEARFLGIADASFNDSTGHAFTSRLSAQAQTADTTNPNRFYNLVQTNSGAVGWKNVLGYVTYNGNDVAIAANLLNQPDGAFWSTASPGSPWNANGGRLTPITVDPTGTLNDLMNACVTANTPAGACQQSATYTAAKFAACTINEVIGDQIKIQCRMTGGAQDAVVWDFIWSISGGALIAGAPSYANPLTRWCGEHSLISNFSQKWYNNGPSFAPADQWDVNPTSNINSSQTTFTVTGALDGTSGQPQIIQIPPTGLPVTASDGTTWKYLQDVQVNDLFMFQDGQGAAGTGYNGEVMKVTAISCGATTCDWTVARAQFNTVGAAHTTSANAAGICNAELVNYVTVWWDYIDDPRRVDTTFAYLLGGSQFATGGSVGNGHDVFASPNFSASPDIWMQSSTWTGDFTAAKIGGNPDFQIQSRLQFAGHYTDTGGSQDYENWDYPNASFKNSEGVVTEFLGGGSFGAGATNITGSIWRWAVGVVDFSPSLPYFGMQGLSLLTDISGPGSLLPNTGSSKICIVKIAGECWAGSLVGEVYADVAILDGPAFQCQKIGENSPYMGHDLCILNPAMWSNSLSQRGFLAGNQIGTNGSGLALTDAKLSRRLLQTFWGGQRQGGGHAAYLHGVPDGSWELYEACIAAPHIRVDFNNANSPPDIYGCSEYMAQIPPQPPADGLIRTNYLTVPITTGTAGGATYAELKYGYEENEPTRATTYPPAINYYCMQYQGGCFWNGSADSPVYSAASATHLGLSTTVNLQIGVPQRVMGYNILYFNGSNAQVGSSGLQWLATDPLAIGGPAISFNQQPISFGTVTVGSSSSPVSLTVTNTGSANLILNAGAVTITGTNAGDFSFSSDLCSSHTVAPSATCTVSVTFTPITSGARAANLVVTDVTDSISGSDSMTGTGQVIGTPSIGFSPNPVSFVTVAVGSSSSPISVTVTNTGTANLILNAGAVSITGAMQPGDFSFSADLCSSHTVAPSATCTVSVTFTPLASGLRTSNLVVTDVTDSVNGSDVMTGTGQGAPSSTGTPKGWLP